MKKQRVKLIIIALVASVGILTGCEDDVEDGPSTWTNKLWLEVHLRDMWQGERLLVYKDYNDWLYSANPLIDSVINENTGSIISVDYIFPISSQDIEIMLYYDIYNADYSYSSWSKESYLLTNNIYSYPTGGTTGSRVYAYIDADLLHSAKDMIQRKTIQNKPFVEYRVIENFNSVGNSEFKRSLVMWKDYRFQLKDTNGNIEYTLYYNMKLTTRVSSEKYQIATDNSDFTVIADLADSTIDVTCQSCGKGGIPQRFKYKLQ